jgi:V/A-type H+-transporting ATPase subunit K
VVNEVDRRAGIRKFITISFLIIMLAVLAVFTVSMARAQADYGASASKAESGATGWAYLAAAVAAGLGCLGAGIAVGYVGAAAVGAVGEKPEVAGRTLIFVGLAEGIAIYGLIIAIMILGKV